MVKFIPGFKVLIFRYSLPISADLFANNSSGSSSQSLTKSFMDFILQRPTTLSEKSFRVFLKVNTQKNIVVEAIADVKNHEKIKSELLIV